MLQIGDWVTWGKGKCGEIRYFSSNAKVVFVKVEGQKNFARVSPRKVRKLLRKVAA